MKNNVPLIYWTFRMAWTVLHFVVVAAAAAALLIWAVTDDRAARAIEPATDSVLTLQQQVANAIPWPWSTGDDSGSYSSSGEEGSDSGSASSDDGDTNGKVASYQVIGNVRVRKEPDVDSKRVKTLGDGDWIEIDCTTNGSEVDPGPYKTEISEWSGVDNSSTTLWDHIPGLGYVSDAYVATGSSGPVAPECTEAEAEAAAQAEAEAAEAEAAAQAEAEAAEAEAAELAEAEAADAEAAAQAEAEAADDRTLTACTSAGPRYSLSSGATSRYSDTYSARVTSAEGGGYELRVNFEASGLEDLRRPEESCLRIAGDDGSEYVSRPIGMRLRVEESDNYVGTLTFPALISGSYEFNYSCRSDYSRASLGQVNVPSLGVSRYDESYYAVVLATKGRVLEFASHGPSDLRDPGTSCLESEAGDPVVSKVVLDDKSSKFASFFIGSMSFPKIPPGARFIYSCRSDYSALGLNVEE
ncbi:MAG: hypothetical protein ACOYEV_07395 [Candidatus Nanopelagicales bacterium]